MPLVADAKIRRYRTCISLGKDFWISISTIFEHAQAEARICGVVNGTHPSLRLKR